MRFRVLLRTEFLKLRRSRAVTVGVLSLLAFVFLVLWGFHSYAAQRLGGISIFGGDSGEPGYFNGLLFALYSLYFAFNFIIPIVIAVVAASQISGEASTGTLRAMLSRPIGRTPLLLSKFAVTAFFAWMIITGFVLFNLFLGFALVGWGDLALYPGPLGLVDVPGSIPMREALLRFLLATFSGTWSLLTLAAIGFFLSVVTRSAVVSVTAAILAYMVLTVVGRVEFFSEIKSHFFTTDMDFWRIVFKPQIPWREVGYGVSRCGVYIFSLLLASAVLFERKDITT